MLNKKAQISQKSDSVKYKDTDRTGSERERETVKYNITDRTKREKVWIIQEHRQSEKREFVKNQETDRKKEWKSFGSAYTQKSEFDVTIPKEKRLLVSFSMCFPQHCGFINFYLS